nr:MAG TPA: hypothetical protein [Caudoviricetes sp.]
MPKWTDYTIKTEPADNDEVMVLDTAGKANKRLGLSALSDWIIEKIANKVFENLQTQNKTILGALNELNSNSSKWALINYPSSDKPLEKLNSPSLIFGLGKKLPYTLIFVDNEGSSDFSGGTSIIYGFMYEDDAYGAQIAMRFDGVIFKRNKNNNVWSKWTIIHS